MAEVHITIEMFSNYKNARIIIMKTAFVQPITYTYRFRNITSIEKANAE